MNHGDCFLLKWHETSINRWDHWRYTYFQAKPVWDDLPQTRSCPNIHGCMSGSETNPWGNGKLGWFGCTQQPNSRTGWWWGKCLDWAVLGSVSSVLGWSDHFVLCLESRKFIRKKWNQTRPTRLKPAKNMLLFPSGYFNVWNISLDKLLLQIPRHYPRPLEIKRALGNGVPPGHASCNHPV